MIYKPQQLANDRNGHSAGVDGQLSLYYTMSKQDSTVVASHQLKAVHAGRDKVAVANTLVLCIKSSTSEIQSGISFLLGIYHVPSSVDSITD